MKASDRLGLFDAPRWEREGRDWPNRASSRFVLAGLSRWHVQVLGSGPDLLLLHGAGGATHSFRDLAPSLAETFRVIVPDLPGHGFTEVPPIAGLGLPAMASGLGELLEILGAAPKLVVGHSAGAAVLCRMALDRRIHPTLLVGINAALLPFTGVAGRVFSPLAKVASRNPLTARVVAWTARDRNRIVRTVEGTGSRLDARGVDLYQRLARCPAHISGTLGMMAEWDLETLARDLAGLSVPLQLIVGARDRAVPPKNAYRIAQIAPRATVAVMRGVGHLSHEEAPVETARLILDRVRGLALNR